MNRHEGLYPLVVSNNPEIHQFDTEPSFSQDLKNFYFALRCNGAFKSLDGRWFEDKTITSKFSTEFNGEKVVFLGPNAGDQIFTGTAPLETLYNAFKNKEVVNTIGKYRQVDQEEAARIAFILGGVVNFMSKKNIDQEDIDKAVRFVASMTSLGEHGSGVAIAMAMSMYAISGGSLEVGNEFKRKVYNMGEAIAEDEVHPRETWQLGLSQVSRLRSFKAKEENQNFYGLPDIEGYTFPFANYPTVGAEFHFPKDFTDKNPEIWQKLALLNMSQYHKGSYIQFSRNDRDVIEVRMNPSIYPIAIANWNNLRDVMPELNNAFFTITLNRPDQNFAWNNTSDTEILNKLKTIGLLTYAGRFKNTPLEEGRQEINFGQIYLGQTFKVRNGQNIFDGLWTGNSGLNGQFALYLGFGDNFPHLAYYLSMSLAEPKILSSVPDYIWRYVKKLPDALTIDPTNRYKIFNTIQQHIQTNSRLQQVYDAGRDIAGILNPKPLE